MKRGAPMKRVGFAGRAASAARGPETTREERLALRAARAMAEVVPTASSISAIGTTCAPVAKLVPFRNEALRRAVASLPCIHCGLAGFSQCAHANTGKGTGTKVSDTRCFPLCADQPGRQGCHARFDQGALFTKLVRPAIEEAWVADTQRRLQAMGLWQTAMAIAPASS